MGPALPAVQRAVLSTLLLILLVSLSSFISEVSASSVPRCFCDKLPPNDLIGSIIDVPFSPRTWRPFRIQFANITRNLEYLFKSTDAGCQVEVKVESISLPLPLVFLRTGRGPFNAATDFAGVLPNSGCCFQGSMILGQSVVSVGNQLGLVIPNLKSPNNSSTTGGDIKLLLRQRCAGRSPPLSYGIEQLAEKTLRTFAINTATASVDSYSGTKLGKGYWSFVPPTNCSVTLQFSAITGDEASLRLLYFPARPFVGVVYIGQSNTEFTLRLDTRTDSVQVTALYNAICDDQWRTQPSVEVPENRHVTQVGEEWRTIAIDEGNVTKNQILVWRLTPLNHTYLLKPQVVAQETTLNYALDSPFDPSYQDILTKLAQTSPLAQGEQYFAARLTTPGQRGRFSFRARAFRDATHPVIHVNSSTNEEWTTFSGMNKWTRLELVASQSNCVVRVRLVNATNNLVVRAHPFGFNPAKLVHDGHSSSQDEVVLLSTSPVPLERGSDGPVIGISAEVLSDGVFQYEIQYMLVCLPYLKNATAATWTRVLLPRRAQFFLRSPSSDVCHIQFSTSMVNVLINKYHRLTCTDLTWTVEPEPYTIVDAKCGGLIIISTYDAQGDADLSYRLKCLNETTEPAFRFPAVGPELLAQGNEWTAFSERSRASVYSKADGLREWTIRPKNDKCRVDIMFKHADLAGLQVVEQFAHLVWDEQEQAERSIIDGSGSYGTLPGHLVYSSCTNTVYVRDLRGSWGYNSFRFTGQIRQRCSFSPQKECNLVNVFTANTEWQSLEFVAVNMNQVQQSSVVIESSEHHQEGTLIELKFMSVIQQNLLIGAFHGRDGFAQSTDSRGVFVQGEPASVGKSFFFAQHNVTITSDIVADRGDHLFRARYRVRYQTSGEVLQEQIDGVVLAATNRPQMLDLNIPKQFSSKRRKSVLKHELVDVYGDDYGDVGMFQAWMYHYQWTIKPRGGVHCRVVVKFRKMDIGSGHLVREYTNFQHRLMVQQPRLLSEEALEFRGTCSHDLMLNSQATMANNGNDVLCARLDQAYVSAVRGSSVRIAFQSSQIGTEYENDDDDDNGRQWESMGSAKGAESTWGAGWQAIYYQDCSPNATRADLVRRASTSIGKVKALNQWQKWTPEFPRSSTESVLFRQVLVTMIPSQPKCWVELLMDCPNPCESFLGSEGYPLQIRDGRGRVVKVPDVSSTSSHHFYNSNFTLIVLGRSKRHNVFVKYRQQCSSSVVP